MQRLPRNPCKSHLSKTWQSLEIKLTFLWTRVTVCRKSSVQVLKCYVYCNSWENHIHITPSSVLLTACLQKTIWSCHRGNTCTFSNITSIKKRHTVNKIFHLRRHDKTSGYHVKNLGRAAVYLSAVDSGRKRRKSSYWDKCNKLFYLQFRCRPSASSSFAAWFTSH